MGKEIIGCLKFQFRQSVSPSSQIVGLPDCAVLNEKFCKFAGSDHSYDGLRRRSSVIANSASEDHPGQRLSSEAEFFWRLSDLDFP
jgi:hypothetical protein